MQAQCPKCLSTVFTIGIEGPPWFQYGYKFCCAGCGEGWPPISEGRPSESGSDQAVVKGGDEPSHLVPKAEGEERYTIDDLMSGDPPLWHPAETMPFDRTIVVKTVTGLIRIARRNLNYSKGGRVHCWRKDKSGDLVAIAWREPVEGLTGW